MADYAKKLYRRADDPQDFPPFSEPAVALLACIMLLAVLVIAGF